VKAVSSQRIHQLREKTTLSIADRAFAFRRLDQLRVRLGAQWNRLENLQLRMMWCAAMMMMEELRRLPFDQFMTYAQSVEADSKTVRMLIAEHEEAERRVQKRPWQRKIAAGEGAIRGGLKTQERQRRKRAKAGQTAPEFRRQVDAYMDEHRVSKNRAIADMREKLGWGSKKLYYSMA
jgi:hypothetical protein